MAIEHKRVEPTILYFGTPVVLISTVSGVGKPCSFWSEGRIPNASLANVAEFS